MLRLTFANSTCGIQQELVLFVDVFVLMKKLLVIYVMFVVMTLRIVINMISKWLQLISKNPVQRVQQSLHIITAVFVALRAQARFQAVML